jgi:uncharacterized protein (TIGR02246 family)
MEAAITTLYHQLLGAWNERSAQNFAALFTEDGNVVGFDGSLMNGRAEIEAELSRIFTHHMTGAYVGKVREVRFLTPEVAVLRSVASTVPHGQNDINPATNTIQSLVAMKVGDVWKIAAYHNTPAAFHGRPELSHTLTEELRALVKA